MGRGGWWRGLGVRVRVRVRVHRGSRFGFGFGFGGRLRLIVGVGCGSPARVDDHQHRRPCVDRRAVRLFDASYVCVDQHSGRRHVVPLDLGSGESGVGGDLDLCGHRGVLPRQPRHRPTTQVGSVQRGGHGGRSNAEQQSGGRSTRPGESHRECKALPATLAAPATPASSYRRSKALSARSTWQHWSTWALAARPTPPHQQQHACRNQADHRHTHHPLRRCVQHQRRRGPSSKRRRDQAQVRRPLLTGVGCAEPSAGCGVNGGSGGPGGGYEAVVAVLAVLAHGRTRFRRSAKRRSPMPLTSRNSSTERKPPCRVR
ncbi:hypothetical protein SAMN05428938_4764 [Streptomyces sp. KS_5]|nr:hypothetical protein SAMN05428938_4764 [Streptomyces sp. KS_5]